jgi:hypothetical protein
LRGFGFGFAGLLTAWWASLVLPWVTVTGAATGSLNAPALSAALGALPVVLLLTLFLVLYTPFRKSLLCFAAVVFAFGAWLGLQNQALQPAVTSLVAEQTGIADAAGQSTLISTAVSIWPLVSVVIATLGASFAILSVFKAKTFRGLERRVEPTGSDDDLWHETSSR